MLNSFFVVIGAALWATDTLFRHPLVQQISALTLVYLEHLIAVAIMGAWVLTFQRRNLIMGFKNTFGAAFIGVFGSALATLLFTSSFVYVNPSVAILLQKVQPILVILMSALFLDERLNRKFWVWCALALGAAFFVSFPNGLSSSEFSLNDSRGVLLALAAAWFWAVSTVAGKVVLKGTVSSVLSFWRFFFGFLALFIFTRMNVQAQIELPLIFSALDGGDLSVLRSIFVMALVPGVIAVTLYYRGLARVPASVATILELSFPLCAMWVNSHYLNLHLSQNQVISAFVLMFAMFQISRLKK